MQSDLREKGIQQEESPHLIPFQPNRQSNNLASAPLTKKIKDVATPILRSMGLELFEVQFSGPMKGGHLRIFIDKEEGVTLDDCAKVSRFLSPALDIEDDMPSDYTLEVSSPGLKRPLRNESDFHRFVGKKVKIETAAKSNHPLIFIGRLLGFNGKTLLLSIDGGNEREIPFEQITKAHLEVDLTFGRNKGGTKK